jgi:hypothetical protein
MTLALDLHLPHHHSSAEFSPDRRYRYQLVRRWNDDLPPLAVVCHNPSVAGEYRNDPTVRRLIGFAKSLGRGGLVLKNLNAGIATDPKDLETMADPVGPGNDAHLTQLAEEHDLIVLAWGANADAARARTVTSRLWKILCRTGGALAAFGWTANHQPRHPLYLPRTCVLQCLTAGAHPDYADVDPRWTRLIVDTSDVAPSEARPRYVP